MKIHEISALGAKRYRNVTKSVPNVKITLFAKCYLDVLKTAFFVDFCRVLIDDFRRFSRIFIDFIAFAHRFERFHEANGCDTRSFSGFLYASEQFSDENP